MYIHQHSSKKIKIYLNCYQYFFYTMTFLFDFFLHLPTFTNISGLIFFTFANILSEKYRDSSSKKYLFLKIDAISTVHVMLHGAQNVCRRIYTHFETQKEKLIGFSCTFGSWELGHHSLPRSLLLQPNRSLAAAAPRSWLSPSRPPPQRSCRSNP